MKTVKRLTFPALAAVALCVSACCGHVLKAGAGHDKGPSATPDSLLVPAGSAVFPVPGTGEYRFLEGPAWDRAGNLFFTDIQTSRIYRYADGAVSLFRDRSNAANGLMFDRGGRLIACEGGAGRVTALDPATGTVLEVLAAEYGGKRFNSPNDLVIDSRGGIYFTDPTWAPQKPQDASGVYYRHPDGAVIRMIGDMSRPNGVQLSPDESILYVDDSDRLEVRAYDRATDGTLSNGRTFAVLKAAAGSTAATADGMAVDREGRVYVTTETGVQIFNSAGAAVTTLPVPETPSNAAFGGADMKTLYITARTRLYAIRLNAAGIEFPLP
ncbi:MAG: SMP-30/gluconolactonase/LRE family protein [bacterium]|nr:SMP-30/gluconolactonase/LRE family protein [bacterium]